MNQKIESYGKATKLNPNNSNAFYNKGNVLRDLKRYHEAIECYDKTIELNPKLFEAFYNKGFAFSELKIYNEAIKCYDKAIEDYIIGDINFHYIHYYNYIQNNTVFEYIFHYLNTDLSNNDYTIDMNHHKIHSNKNMYHLIQNIFRY